MTNEDLERAFVREALADARARPAMRVVSRLALLVRGGKSQTAGLGRGMAKEVLPLQFNAFSEESEALAWLNEEASPD